MSFVGIEILKRNEEVIDIKGLAGKECVAGYDLSATEDFTSACLEFPLDDGNVLYYLIVGFRRLKLIVITKILALKSLKIKVGSLLSLVSM